MSTFSAAHKETVNCGSNYGQMKFWFEGATQTAELEGTFAVLFDGKAYFYDSAFFGSFGDFMNAASVAFSDGRFDDLVIEQSNGRVVVLA